MTRSQEKLSRLQRDASLGADAPCDSRTALRPGVLAEIRGYRRTGHAIVNVTRRGRTRRYRVTLARFYWLRFWLIILCPWRTGGAWMRGSLDVTVCAQLRDDAGTTFRRRQWRDFCRTNRKHLPRRALRGPVTARMEARPS